MNVIRFYQYALPRNPLAVATFEFPLENLQRIKIICQRDGIIDYAKIQDEKGHVQTFVCGGIGSGADIEVNDQKCTAGTSIDVIKVDIFGILKSGKINIDFENILTTMPEVKVEGIVEVTRRTV